MGQTGNPEFDDPNFYYTLGEYRVTLPNGAIVGVIGYVRKMTILNDVQFQEKQKEKLLFDPNKYRYELVLISNSRYQNELTSTWLYGVQIKVNEFDITSKDYPNNDYNVLVKTKPTVIYWRETSLEMLLMEIKWNNAIYDPRKVK
jgi:hypothetical protein